MEYNIDKLLHLIGKMYIEINDARTLIQDQHKVIQLKDTEINKLRDNVNLLKKQQLAE